MKNNILVLLFLLTSILSYSQDEPILKAENKVFFLELGGNSIIYSLGFDTRFKKTQKDGLGMSVGLGLLEDEKVISWKSTGGSSSFAGYDFSWPEANETEKVFQYMIPIKLNYLLSLNKKKTHLFELGLGVNINNLKKGFLTPDWDDKANVSFIGTFAYRFQPNNSSFFFRTGFSPPIYKKSNTPNSIVGFSLGFTF